MGKLSKKYTRTNKKQNKKRKKTQRVKRVKRGGHLGEKLRHYHLKVKTPTGKSIELSELFAESGKAIGENGEEIDIKSQTIGDLKQKIIDSESASGWDFTLNKPKPSWIINPATNEPKPFTLFWKGKALLNEKTKLRDIIVDGERLPLYRHSKEIEPIVIVLNEDLEYPRVVETEVIKDTEYEDTPPEE